MCVSVFFFFKKTTAYEMRISDWSSDVCSSDLHRAGRLRDAAAIYGQLLKSNPRQPEVLHLLAVAVHQMGDSRAAEPLLRAAIGLNPRAAAYRNNFGMVLRALGRREDAIASFRDAARLDKGYADPLVNLGEALPRATHEAEARRCLWRACVLRSEEHTSE